MCLQPTIFKCSFVFRLLSQHTNQSFIVSAFNTSRAERKGQDTFARLGSNVNKWIRGVQWQAWNGTSRQRAVWIVQEKVRFHRDYWSTAAGSAIHPLASKEDPQTPSYVHITDRLAACCVWRGSVYASGVWSASKAKGWVEHSLWPVNSSGAPRQQTTGEGGQMRGRTVEQRSIQQSLWLLLLHD